MKLSFTKMHGCGNDYIYFNCLEPFDTPPDWSKAAVRLSDRRFGIGGDGIVLICPSGCADVKMRMFNADGSEGKMCGNAIRCVGKYVYERGYAVKDTITVETLSGIKTLNLEIKDGKVTSVTVNMGKAVLKPSEIPALYEGEKAIGKTLSVEGRDYTVNAISVGNPHCVLFAEHNTLPDSVFDYETGLAPVGRPFECSPVFPEGVNTEFARLIGKNIIEMRVWERGSGETFACGTGACATAVAAVECDLCERNTPVTVRLRGGDLSVLYADDGTVFMTGPAETVFDGTVNID